MNTEPSPSRDETLRNTSRQEPLPAPRKEEGLHCPICFLPTGRRMRGKIYCGNCGFIES